MILASLLSRVIKVGSLALIDANGRYHRFGTANAARSDEPEVVIRLHDPRLHRDLVLNPRLRFGEAYMDGLLSIERGTIYDALELFARNTGTGSLPFLMRLGDLPGSLFRFLQQRNPLGLAERHVAHHYDLSRRLYELFLDRDMQYSCAYFARPDMSLEEAQEAKKRHIASKLLLRPNLKVLDIGSGWGGLGLYLARTAGVEVTGVTLSREQHALAEQRAAEARLNDKVRFLVRDYREETGTYDRIVSVGMFEHVGVPHYREFFRKIGQLLADDGIALLHAIGRMDGPGTTNPWIRKYIFPGGYCPALSEVLTAIEQTGLWVTDVEVLRLHYAETLRAWRTRFMANREEIARLYDERFCRMWEFYLAGSEVSFRHQGHMVFQIQLAKRVDAVPLTRDYMYDWERRQAKTAGLAA